MLVIRQYNSYCDNLTTEDYDTEVHFKLMIFSKFADVEEDEQFKYPQGLVLVPLGRDENSVVVGSHIRGSRLRASSAAGDKEVDLLLPGTAR